MVQLLPQYSSSINRMKLKFVVFNCGLAVMVLEFVGVRMAAPYFGNTIFTWTSMVGVVLAALSVGYYAGGRIADNTPRQRVLSGIILLSAVFFTVITLISGLLLPFTENFAFKFRPLVWSLGVLFIPSVLLGIVSPYVVKLETKNLNRVGRTAGGLYALSAVGSIFGTFLTGFVLIQLLDLSQILNSVSVLLFLTSLLILRKKDFVLAVCVFLLPVFLSCRLAPQTDEDFVFHKQTSYHVVDVLDKENQRALFLDGIYQGSISLDSNEILHPYYHHLKLAFAFNPKIKRALVLGTGAGLGSRIFCDEYGVDVDSVDIDPVVNYVARNYFFMPDDVKVFSEDARVFLRNSPERYDLIVVDAYDAGSSVPFHLMTRETAEDISKHLTEDGVVLVNVVSTVGGECSKFPRSVYKTYQTVFPNVYAFYVFEANEKDLNNVLIIAKKGKSEDFTVNAACMGLQEFADKHFTPLKTDDVPVITDDYAPIDNLVIPCYAV